LIFALVADGTLFASLVFGTLYLWISAPNWPPAQTFAPDLRLALAAIAALLVAATAARGSLRSLVAGGMTRGWIGLAALGLVVAIALVVGLIGNTVPRPTEHALGATVAALLAFIALHAAVGLLFLLSNLLRLGAGFVSSRRSLDLRLTRLWLDYTLLTGVLALGLVLALPTLVRTLGT